MIFCIWIVFQIYKRKIFSFQNFHCEKILLFAYSVQFQMHDTVSIHSDIT